MNQIFPDLISPEEVQTININSCFNVKGLFNNCYIRSGKAKLVIFHLSISKKWIPLTQT